MKNECPECGETFEEYYERWEVRRDGFEDLVRECPSCHVELDRFEPLAEQ